ncbi:DUF2938 family protein (plasmid) [Thioclava sp. 'Guangxiensis']|uniref:DUF2938 family protein n=1 Tax=Thioclava sp. 'Guangxiensis' TaxID=3149044 RepID=UPI0032C3F48F
MFTDIVLFTLVVGIGSTIALDLWGVFTGKIGWMPGTHWPSVGRWIQGLPAGRLVFDGSDTRPFTSSEAATGWIFHYLIGLGYALVIPLVWGTDFIAAPTFLPFFWIGIVISTLAGLVILMPGMGGGVFARKLPNTAGMIAYVLVAHVVFAIAQYLLALMLS